jgi:hypothetical protein
MGGRGAAPRSGGAVRRFDLGPAAVRVVRVLRLLLPTAVMGRSSRSGTSSRVREGLARLRWALAGGRGKGRA